MNKYSVLLAMCMCALVVHGQTELSQTSYVDFNHGQTGDDHHTWVQSINVRTPAYRSSVKGEVEVCFEAPGMDFVKAMCWSQPTIEKPDVWGHDVELLPQGTVLGEDGLGCFTFDADKLPNGPMNVRIYAHNKLGEKDVCELQLYNLGGVSWNQGVPSTNPPGARGMLLVFQDDFDGPLSISNDGRNAQYSAHKPRFGDFSGWPFTDVDAPNSPFSQVDTYLKIAARKTDGDKGSTGLIASVNMDGEGFWAKAPFYMECRFTAQSAVGTWPAFWTITALDKDSVGDELDIVEAYGGVGKGNPNHPGYSICSHFWGQKDGEGKPKKEYSGVIPITEIGGGAYWSTTFHTYGLYVDKEHTIYYFDNIEVYAHPTNSMSWEKPHLFLINYAIGGISGWPIDLVRYDNGSDMYVDYVRVYAKEPIDYSLPLVEKR